MGKIKGCKKSSKDHKKLAVPKPQGQALKHTKSVPTVPWAGPVEDTVSAFLDSLGNLFLPMPRSQ